MNAANQLLIVRAAERCECEMRREFAYVLAGDYESASHCALAAEIDSWLAFHTATAGRSSWMVGEV